MARREDTIIGQAAYGLMGTPNTLSLDVGGFFGWSPDLGNFLSDQAYVRKPLELVVLESPRFFNLMPNPERWQASFRNMIETKVIRAEGFNAAVTVSTDDHAVGGAGEMMQEPVDSKRARTEPVLNFIEKYGRPIQRMIDIWIRYAIMDPEVKFAMLTTLGSNVPTDLLADWYSATILAYETDPIHKGIEKAWLTTNFYPLGTGEIIGVRDLTEPSALTRLSIPFAGISAVGNGINAFAQEIMNASSRVGADPFNRRAWLNEISPDVAAAANAGIYAGMRRTADESVMPVVGG